MQRQKSKFWNFIFSFIPGGGQMYLGFMKRGLSLMVLFAAIIAIATLTRFGGLAAFCAIVWFYAFFDALNLNSMPAENFLAQQDDFLLVDPSIIQQVNKKRVRLIAGWALVLGGICAIWNMFASRYLWNPLYDLSPELYYSLRPIVEAIPGVILCGVLIVLGVRMIRGKQQEALVTNENAQ